MNPRRRQILKELNLLPVWRLKSDAAQQNTLPTLPAPPEVATGKSLFSSAPEKDAAQPPVSQMNWDQLKAAVSQCVACPLSQTRTQTVFGVGDQNADWLFVGEGPGAREDEIGEPFVGQAGKLLDQMLTAIQLKRGEGVYIANIVKCRPPNNRNPALSEAQQCAPFLTRQIALIKPKLIVALGKVAAQNLLNRDDSISSLRGKVHSYSGIPLIVTYHPAYLLRSLPDKAKAWKDLCFARSIILSSR
ncbi:MAG: uracil-DNA glycosylase [Gammaproteobacteria bacterium]|jgi:DNA polymerase|nr:uracil-DNA glycosylase [Pseudomonadota bacterium]QOJ20281.1 MAG: uracil-DNA glycosylase [Gammaproteobacteria bacterium]